ncbi:hypothetical protein L2719_02125 [Shewanella schlegeliana]|uniref:SMODS-associating 2TM beta-strand rich effector domain-containing protein n=1 Tax=Shewanella schlegeliana TaxID=190308 RepID=A0ABS1SY42_9GAMM|nr:hypothetical protein [Shewanella schlegeliana]MBL4913473.1 hypothetical protein [Shewanella schlegeliana]MCL1108363.1 hypothetical protein [Shewanella schlegeliana]
MNFIKESSKKYVFAIILLVGAITIALTERLGFSNPDYAFRTWLTIIVTPWALGYLINELIKYQKLPSIIKLKKDTIEHLIDEENKEYSLTDLEWLIIYQKDDCYKFNFKTIEGENLKTGFDYSKKNRTLDHEIKVSPKNLDEKIEINTLDNHPYFESNSNWNTDEVLVYKLKTAT